MPVRCSVCGSEAGIQETYFPLENANLYSVYYCPSCLERFGVTCQRCSSVVGRDTTEEVITRRSETQIWCRHCVDYYASHCSECDTFLDVRFRSMVEVIGLDFLVCVSCAEAYDICAECGERAVELDAMEVCEVCQERINEESARVIHEHDFKPRPVFYGNAEVGAGRNRRYLGVEVEVNVPNYTRDESAQIVQAALEEHGYLKSDGSIGYGFEIVSHPHSLTEHAKLWKRVCDKWPRGITSYNAGTCGIHVHISRDALSPLQIGKMLVFLNRAENRDFIVAVAQRESADWARFDNRKQYKNAVELPQTRYEALNLCNRHTVELRIFRGNTRYERIMKALEFADALASFAGQVALYNLAYQEFIKFVAASRKQWPNLFQYLTEKGYIVSAKARRSEETSDKGDN